jgi:hypothetical protein
LVLENFDMTAQDVTLGEFSEILDNLGYYRGSKHVDAFLYICGCGKGREN